MGVPSAAVVYTGAAGEMSGSGKGAAYSEDVSSTLENTNQWLKDIREDERLRNEEQKKKAEAWNTMLEETPDIWNIDFEKVNEKSLAFNTYVKSLQSAGYDPYNLPPDKLREMQRLEAEVVKETNSAKANKEYWDKNTFNIKEDAGKTWDEKYAAEWFRKYADPNLSPSERAKMRQGDGPYMKKVNLFDLVSDVSGEMSEYDIIEGENKITRKDLQGFKNLLGIHFKSPGGADDYESLMRIGGYKNEDELIKEAETIFKALNPETSLPKDKPKKTGTTSVAQNKDQWQASAAREDEYGGNKANSNLITFKPGNAKVVLKDQNGDPFSIISMFAHYDEGSKKYVIRAKVRDEEDLIVTKTFPISPIPGESGNLNYEQIQGVIGSSVKLKDLFNKPIKSGAPQKETTTAQKPAGFPAEPPNE